MSKFINAIELAKDSDSFNLDVDYSLIVIGAFVKVCEISKPSPERYWVEVTYVNISDQRIRGTIANNLMFVDRDHGDTIEFSFGNVYDLYIGEIGEGDESDNIRGVHAECN